MGVKWQVFLESGVFQRYKGRGLKNFSRVIPQTPPYLLPSLFSPPPLWTRSAGPCPLLSLFFIGKLNESINFFQSKLRITGNSIYVNMVNKQLAKTICTSLWLMYLNYAYSKRMITHFVTTTYVSCVFWFLSNY